MKAFLDFIFMYHLLSSTTYSNLTDKLVNAMSHYDSIGQHCGKLSKTLKNVIYGFDRNEPMVSLRKILWENFKLAIPDTRITVTGSYTPREWSDLNRYNWLLTLESDELESFIKDQRYIEYRQVFFGLNHYNNLKFGSLRYNDQNWGWFDLVHRIGSQPDVKDVFLAKIREVFGITQDTTSLQLGNEPELVSRSEWVTQQLAKQKT